MDSPNFSSHPIHTFHLPFKMDRARRTCEYDDTAPPADRSEVTFHVYNFGDEWCVQTNGLPVFLLDKKTHRVRGLSNSMRFPFFPLTIHMELRRIIDYTKLTYPLLFAYEMKHLQSDLDTLWKGEEDPLS